MLNKKWQAGLLAGTLLLGLLSGCGGAKEQTAQGESGQEGGKINLRLYTYGTEEAYNWKETLAAYEAKTPGVTIELVQLSEKGDTQEAFKKLDLEAASSAQMDILMFSDPAGYAQRVALGMAEPLDEYIAKDGFSVEEDYKVDTRLDGKVYALPGKFNPWYVLLNKDHLKEAGLAVPTDWTWDDYADYAKKLTQGEGSAKRYGTYFHGPQGGGWLEFLKLKMANQPQDTDFLKADGTSNLDNPTFRETLELRVRMEKEDQSSVPYTDMISQKLNYRTQFFNQSASMITIGSWMNTEIGGTDKVPLEFEVAVAPFPKNKEGDPTGLTPVTTDYVAVAAKSKHKEEAYKFVRWYTTEGQVVQGKNIPAWQGVKSEQVEKIIDTILAGTKSPEKVDKKSLIDTLVASKASAIVPPAPYQAEVYEAINEEYEKLILGNQDIDQTIRNSQERVNKIIESNQK
ncbi:MULTISPECIES: ABC transporter substrate-binding protein [Paenibacillus]|uniref:Extracellular solute-binding protein family 1 n=2 Tax=Paenibacillus lactis TaxID=228574 RepID=G4HNJ2_9BACL|nr:sugar ABC transporter substrate-binding protein [Paenibacillus lactis]EHB50157.1 extracellular solute-binding protein family 1 [Paenibacillus lactis 154]MBP1896387.1 multiple sugar transport system substrate-binding protein [Paenibacillus lactis]HAG01046.1 sugar ABC transporter substrate-binding protein [Paenibacillus lactis]